MLSILLKGHHFSYDVFELVRVFYPSKKIHIIDEEALVDNQSFFIESSLKEQDRFYVIETTVFEAGQMIKEHKKELKKDAVSHDKIKKMCKITIKQSIYDVLSELTGSHIPWGILTGIRPTKIVHELMDEGKQLNEILRILEKTYKLSYEKASLIIGVAKKERPYLYPLNKNKFSLYVSIPFCPTRCVYCSFPSHPMNKWEKYVRSYIDKLLYEIEQVGERTKNMTIETVYIGGGTPTAISTQHLEKIILKIQNIYGKDNIKEFTVEAGRPDTINKDVLTMLKRNHIERISINPQSMCQKTLDTIGRSHRSEDIITAYNLAREIGFEAINMDIIVGLPGEGLAEIQQTMAAIEGLQPDNLTVHTMAVKRASKLRESIDAYPLAQHRLIEEMIKLTKDYAEKMSMSPYYMYRQKQMVGNFENVGYAKDGKACIYNMLIMEEKQTIMAVGAGAISKVFSPETNRVERVPNVKGLKEYIERIDEMINRKEKHLSLIDI